MKRIIVKLVKPGDLGRVVIVGDNQSDNVTIIGDLVFEMPGGFGTGEQIDPQFVYAGYRFQQQCKELVGVLLGGVSK
jgi:hypothetical protein